MNIPQKINTIEHGNINSLFRSAMNTDYLRRMVCDVLTNRYYLGKYARELGIVVPGNLAEQFHERINEIARSVDPSEYRLPYKEDLPYDILEQLHNVNSDYIVTMCKNMIGNPSLVIRDYYDFDPHEGYKIEPYSIGKNGVKVMEQQYSAASYSTGYWDPLEDIKNRADNKYKAYHAGDSYDVLIDASLPRDGSTRHRMPLKAHNVNKRPYAKDFKTREQNELVNPVYTSFYQTPAKKRI